MTYLYIFVLQAFTAVHLLHALTSAVKLLKSLKNVDLCGSVKGFFLCAFTDFVMLFVAVCMIAN